MLLIGFGSVLAAVLPLVTALLCIGRRRSACSGSSPACSASAPPPRPWRTMIGLGVGIDYALFLTTRFRQLIDRRRRDPTAAAGRAVATSGHAVLVAAGTVAVALLGLYASGIVFIGQLGLRRGRSTVAIAALGGDHARARPALGLLGRADRPPRGAPAGGRDRRRRRRRWHRYARTVTPAPWWFFGAGWSSSRSCRSRCCSIRLGHVDDGADPTSFTDKRAYDLISAGFGPGANGPFTVVVDLSGATALGRQHRQLGASTRVAAAPGVAHVGRVDPVAGRRDPRRQVTPATGPQDAATSGAVRHA